MGMGWKEIKEEFEQEKAKERAKMEAKKQAKMEVRGPEPSEREKLAKKGNILVTGFSIWLLIPVFAFIAIIGVVAVVGVYDWIFG